MTDTAVRDALGEAAAAAGLRVDPTFEPDTLAGLAGPFITMNIEASGDGGIVAVVALRDGPGADDELLAALADAAASVTTGATTSAAEPAPSGAEIEARFAMSIDVTALTDGDEVQAIVVNAVDRRGENTDQDDEEGDGLGAADAADFDSGSEAPQPAEPAPVAIPGGAAVTSLRNHLDKLVNVELGVSVELGRAQVTLADVLSYDVGSVIELDRAAGSPVDIRVNGMLLAQGEVVVIDDEYAVRITAVVDHQTE